MSSLRAALALGLDFPVACILSIGLRVMYGAFPYISPIDIPSIRSDSTRTQLEDVPVVQTYFTRSELVDLYRGSSIGKQRGLIRRAIDMGHVISFWAMAADSKTHLVDANTLERFQRGTWADEVVQRRCRRVDVLPLWRGGPISVAGHSWFVDKLFGIKVYKP
jgi:hypothetical protein